MNWLEVLSLSSKHLELETPLDTVINIPNLQGNTTSIRVIDLHNIALFISALNETVDKCIDDFVKGFRYNCPTKLLTPDAVYAIITFLESLKVKHKIAKYHISSCEGYVDVTVFDNILFRCDATNTGILN